MSQRDCLKPWKGKRIKARGFLRALPYLRDVALVDEVEAELDNRWVQIGHAWIQKADQFNFVKLIAHDLVEFTAVVSVREYSNDTKIGFCWPKHIRPLQGHEEPTGAKDIPMTTQTFNLIRSAQRKTQGQKRFVAVNGKWRRVIFVN